MRTAAIMLRFIKGAALASNELQTEITLTGDQEEIKQIIAEQNLSFYGELKIVPANDVISMHDEPTSLLKAHAESSMALAFKELAEDRAEAFVSAGSTGAIVVGGTLLVKRRETPGARQYDPRAAKILYADGYGGERRLPP